MPRLIRLAEWHFMPKHNKAGTGKDSVAARRHKFVEAYIKNGGNATEAAKIAGFSEKTADQQGSRLLKDVNVSAAIAERMKAIATKYELDTELVIKSLVQELRFDPACLYNENGSLKKITELDEDTRAALTGIEVNKIGGDDSELIVTHKVRWSPKQHAREQAMKHLGMFEKDNKQKADPIRALLEEIDARSRPVVKS